MGLSVWSEGQGKEPVADILPKLSLLLGVLAVMALSCPHLWRIALTEWELPTLKGYTFLGSP